MLTVTQVLILQAEVSRLMEELAAATNKLEMAEAVIAGDGALITGLKNELAAAQAVIEQMREYFDLIKQRFCGWHTVAEEALAQPANLDALHEARALECERLANSAGDVFAKHWLLSEASCRRAQKEATKGEGK